MSTDLVNPPPGYEVIDYLGGGAMGDVYLARQVSLGRQVALKVSKKNIASELHTTLDRLLDEALTVARLDHPNIVPVYDCISHDSRVFIVMKHVEGFTLGELLKGNNPEFLKPPYSHFFKDGKLRREAIVEIGLRLAEGLAYAHERGIYHRDIKPSNIFIDHKGKVVLIDFGIARDSTRAGMTATGVVVGTPHYMSPEQIRGMPLDGRSDLYAVGCVLYHCITGRVPFSDTNEVMVCIKHLNDPVPNIESLAAEPNPLLNGIIMSLLEKDRENRMPSAEELAEQLLHIEPGSSTSIRSASILRGLGASRSSSGSRKVEKGPAPPVEIMSDETIPLAKQPPESKHEKKKRALPLVAFALLLLVIAGAGLVLVSEKPDHGLPINLDAFKRESWLYPLLQASPTEVSAGVEAPSGEDTDVALPIPTLDSSGRVTLPEVVRDSEDVVAASTNDGEAEADEIVVAAIPPPPTPTPTPSPTPTPEPTPVPLWMAVAPPGGLAVDQSGWQPFIDWIAPRGQRYELLNPVVAPELEVIGNYAYAKLLNPGPDEMDVALIASVRVTSSSVRRTPFGIVHDEPKAFLLHSGTPFPDSASSQSIFDSRRLVIPAGSEISVPLLSLSAANQANLSAEMELTSMVAVGRGPRLIGNSSAGANDIVDDLKHHVRNLLEESALSARFGVDAFTGSDDLRRIVQTQTRNIMPAMPRDPARFESISESEAIDKIVVFLGAVESRAADGSLLLPSLITNQRLEGTINGGAELELTLEAAPGDLMISAVVLSGMQKVTVSHTDGVERSTVRPLSGFGVSDYPVRLSSRGGRVRVPIVRWAMQDNQTAITSSAIELGAIAVLVYRPDSIGQETTPPHFRRIINLNATR